MKTFPSYVFAALGAALLALGVIGLIWGDSGLTRTICAFVGVIGIVQIIFGGLRRREEAGEPHVLRGPAV